VYFSVLLSIEDLLKCREDPGQTTGDYAKIAARIARKVAKKLVLSSTGCLVYNLLRKRHQ
jgi:hypothetical protein